LSASTEQLHSCLTKLLPTTAHKRFDGKSWSVFQKPTVGAYYTFGTSFQLDGKSQAQRVAPDQTARDNRVISPNEGMQPDDARCFKNN
jgi:hypothetical protein